MCLSSIDFALTRVKGEYVGTGYKVYRIFDHEKLQELSSFRWKEASNNCYTKKNYNRISASAGGTYPPGFHIWLKQLHAENYRTIYSGYRFLYKVAFKDVIAFGKNENHCQSSFPYKTTHEPCIIASKMKILEFIKELT